MEATKSKGYHELKGASVVDPPWKRTNSLAPMAREASIMPDPMALICSVNVLGGRGVTQAPQLLVGWEARRPLLEECVEQEGLACPFPILGYPILS